MRRTISPLPELGAVFQSRRLRWWLWKKRQRLGRSFLQLEPSPSAVTHRKERRTMRKKTTTARQRQELILIRDFFLKNPTELSTSEEDLYLFFFLRKI